MHDVRGQKGYNSISSDSQYILLYFTTMFFVGTDFKMFLNFDPLNK